MKKNIRNIILKALNILSLVLMEVFICCFSFTSIYTNQNAELSILSAVSKNNNSDMYFFNTIYDKGDEQIPVNYFSRTYGSNFWKSLTKVISVCDDVGPIKYSCYIGDTKLEYDTCIVSGLNYTQNQELVRFETVCINLYKYRTKQEEIYFDQSKYDGFIYIPDYFADSIIEIISKKFLSLGFEV